MGYKIGEKKIEDNLFRTFRTMETIPGAKMSLSQYLVEVYQ
jgi:hypothetical protein